MPTSLLMRPPLVNIRRNHALEHATIHLLSQRYPERTFIGRSDARGFYIYGQVPTEALTDLVQQGLARLKRGDRALAIHPNCGTNLVTSGLLAGSAAFLSLFGSEREGWRKRLERFPLVVLSTIIALLIAQPVGRSAQEHITTEADPGTLHVLRLERFDNSGMAVHRVFTSL
ncbi:MAG: DUF6391 domain-containing protein [Anaerolineales bacterium]